MRALFALALLLSGAAQAANVTLDGQGNITGIFNLPQPGLNTTVISDNDARIATFVAAHAIPGTPNAGLITKQQFLGRFTGPELLAIATAAQTIPQVNVWLITAQA